MLSMASLRETSTRWRIGRMPHSLIDTGITGGFVIVGEFEAIRCFKTLKCHLPLDSCPDFWAIDANVVINSLSSLGDGKKPWKVRGLGAPIWRYCTGNASWLIQE